MIREIVLAASTLLLATGNPAIAQTEAPIPVAVVVSIPTPASLTRTAIEQGMQKSLPTYRSAPGLLRKYFTIGSRDFGGIYLFKSGTDAQNWFNDAWSKRVQTTYGVAANVTHFEVPIVLDNAAIPASAQAK